MENTEGLITKILKKKSVDHDILASVLALSDNSSKNQWINTSEIGSIARKRVSNLKRREILKSLTENNILIQDKSRIKFYDDETFEIAKKKFEDAY